MGTVIHHHKLFYYTPSSSRFEKINGLVIYTLCVNTSKAFQKRKYDLERI